MLALYEEDIWHSLSIISLALSVFEVVTFQLNRYFVGFLYVVYECHLSLPTASPGSIRFTNRNEETEPKVVFLLSWVHEQWFADLAKNIFRWRQHLSVFCN